jgi:hypothetical protein
LGFFRGKVAHRRRLSAAVTIARGVVDGGGPSVRSMWRRRREVRHGGQPRRRTDATVLIGAEAVKRGREAPVAWRRQATAASARCSDSAVGVARSDTGPVGSGTGSGGFGPGERTRRGFGQCPDRGAALTVRRTRGEHVRGSVPGGRHHPTSGPGTGLRATDQRAPHISIFPY